MNYYSRMFLSNMKNFARFKKNVLKWHDPVVLFHMMDCVSQCRMYADLAINMNDICVDEYNQMNDLIFKMKDQAFERAIELRTDIWSLIQDYDRKEVTL